jgi:L-amino acid N-acyltransferase YncA
MTAADWPAVRLIFEDGIATGDATFETEAPAWERWDASHLEAARLVARRGDTVLGRLAGRWRDVVLLERRSSQVGVERAEGSRPG